jgi:hypothetical protein
MTGRSNSPELPFRLGGSLVSDYADLMQTLLLARRKAACGVRTLIRCLVADRFSRGSGLLLALLLAFDAMGQTLQPPKAGSIPSAPAGIATTNSPWERIVMIGASVSAGFTESELFGGPRTPQYRLSRYVDAALLLPHEPVQNLGNAMFFMAPEAAGRRQIEQAIKTGPTMVIGIDFLFWFCYGNVRTNEDRLQRFENGLRLLETIQCPLVVGDIPDASRAANGILSEDEIPGAQVMSAANRRLKEWAATHPKVVVLDLSGFMRATMANRPLTIHGHTWPAGESHALLQDDELHPSQRGCAVLALAILDAGLSRQPGFSAANVCWNPEEVLRLALSQRATNNPAIQPASTGPGGKQGG